MYYGKPWVCVRCVERRVYVRSGMHENTVKKGQWFSRPQPGCHLPNSPWPGIIKLVWIVTSQLEKIANFFYSEFNYSLWTVSLKGKERFLHIRLYVYICTFCVFSQYAKRMRNTQNDIFTVNNTWRRARDSISKNRMEDSILAQEELYKYKFCSFVCV